MGIAERGAHPRPSKACSWESARGQLTRTWRAAGAPAVRHVRERARHRSRDSRLLSKRDLRQGGHGDRRQRRWKRVSTRRGPSGVREREVRRDAAPIFDRTVTPVNSRPELVELERSLRRIDRSTYSTVHRCALARSSSSKRSVARRDRRPGHVPVRNDSERSTHGLRTRSQAEMEPGFSAPSAARERHWPDGQRVPPQGLDSRAASTTCRCVGDRKSDRASGALESAARKDAPSQLAIDNASAPNCARQASPLSLNRIPKWLRRHSPTTFRT